jgi:hypothetical protein
MFFRRSVIDQHKLFFNDNYRDLGDVDWVVRAIQQRVPMKHLRFYTSIFAETGENMNLKPNAMRERKVVADQAPLWARKGKPLLEKAYQASRFLQGGYFQKPFSYSIYTRTSPAERVTFRVEKPTPFWNRVPLAEPAE